MCKPFPFFQHHLENKAIRVFYRSKLYSPNRCPKCVLDIILVTLVVQSESYGSLSHQGVLRKRTELLYEVSKRQISSSAIKNERRGSQQTGYTI